MSLIAHRRPVQWPFVPGGVASVTRAGNRGGRAVDSCSRLPGGKAGSADAVRLPREERPDSPCLLAELRPSCCGGSPTVDARKPTAVCLGRVRRTQPRRRAHERPATTCRRRRAGCPHPFRRARRPPMRHTTQATPKLSSARATRWALMPQRQATSRASTNPRRGRTRPDASVAVGAHAGDPVAQVHTCSLLPQRPRWPRPAVAR